MSYVCSSCEYQQDECSHCGNKIFNWQAQWAKAQNAVGEYEKVLGNLQRENSRLRALVERGADISDVIKSAYSFNNACKEEVEKWEKK